MSGYIVPGLILILFLYCLLKRVAIFDAFCEGATGAIPLVVSVFPFLVGMFFMIELCESSGFISYLEGVLSPIFGAIGIPQGVIKLAIFRPFSGSGSLVILKEVWEIYGVDSFVGRTASCICGAGETVFYLVAVYFSSQGIKKLGSGMAIALFCAMLSVILCALMCRIF